MVSEAQIIAEHLASEVVELPADDIVDDGNVEDDDEGDVEMDDDEFEVSNTVW